ncbi:ead/Ea22-like family protein [Salmonella enterica]|uniref:ead/Ea22-like family protein n=1 Tax=Salmonella enterica TaxID=28901 RepID=UPI00192E2AA4|nr:ead/Ea22-like family protein [Salmonella enterica]MBL6367810.1 ead/Ea22-like family protein [Salmonella enterica subsp. enterica serovar Typhimurium]
MNIDKRTLREVAEKATPGPWKVFSDIDTKTFSIHTPRDKRCENVIKWGGFDCQPNAEANADLFIAAFNPKVALALLDENIQLQREKDAIEAVALALRDDMQQAREQLAAAEKLNAVQQRSLDHRKFLLLSADEVQRDFAEALGCAGDNESIMEAIDDMKQRIAELESRTVNLSKLSVGEVMHMSGFSRDYADGWCAGNDNAIHEIRTAGIKVKES